MKKKIKYIMLSILIILLIPLLINYYVIFSVKDKILDKNNYNKVDDSYIILILGASVRGGKPSPMLEDRLKKGMELYNESVSNTILVSGDHINDDYDEVTTMKNYLVDNNIPSDSIIMDHRGTSTYESIYRVKEVFNKKKIIIVTQKYHLYRALYIANYLDLEAYGVQADNIRYKGYEYREGREILARNKDFVKGIISNYK